MKGILKGKVKPIALPEDGLSAAALACQYYSHAGFPEATDSLAYDAVQKLVAVRLSLLINAPGRLDAQFLISPRWQLTELRAPRFCS